MVGAQVIFWRYTAPICYGIWSRIWFIMLDGTFKKRAGEMTSKCLTAGKSCEKREEWFHFAQ